MPHASGESAQIRFSHFTEEFGLSSNDIQDVMQGAGWIWLATSQGVNQFYVHKNIVHRHDASQEGSISSDHTTSLARGLKGAIWIGTADAGLNQYDPETGIFTRVYPGKVVAGQFDATELPSFQINKLATSADQKSLWIGTDKGLAVMDLTTHKVSLVKGPLTNAHITEIATFGESEVWVGTARGGLYRSDHGEPFTHVTLRNAPITAIERDSRFQVWMGTEGAGLYRIEGGNQSVRIAPELRDITEIVADENGDLWVGTAQGVAKKIRHSEEFYLYSSIKGDPHSLVDNRVTSIFQDTKNKILWVATEGGMSRFTLDQYLFPVVRNGVSGHQFTHPSICSMAASVERDKVWVGTESGVFQWAIDSQQVIHNLPGLDLLDSVYAIAMCEDSSRNLWIGTKGEGLVRRHPSGQLFHYFNERGNANSLGHNYVSSVFEDSRGRVWVGTHGEGIYQFNDTSSQSSFIKQRANGENLNFVTQIGEDSTGRVWASGKGGIFSLSRDEDLWQKGTGKNAFDGLTDISTFVVAHDSLWVGTQLRGFAHIDLTNASVETYSTSNSPLNDNRIVALAVDAKDSVWIATSKGISKFDTVKSSIRNFGDEHGLLPGSYVGNAVAKASHSRDGERIFFGGKEGFNPIAPETIPDIVEQPRAMLVDFEYFGEDQKPSEDGILTKPLSALAVLEIPFDSRNKFAFKFANLDIRLPNQGHFRYQLENYDEAWILADKERRASYQSIPVGNYVFQVQISKDGINWPGPEGTVQLKVKVTPPWYNRWWFRSVAWLVGTLGGYFILRYIYRSRVQDIERREAEVSMQRDKAQIALSRQLQHAVLIERASRGPDLGGKADEIFSHSLRHLADYLRADYAVIFKVIENKETGIIEGLELIANHAVSGKDKLPLLPLKWDSGLVNQSLRSDTSIVSRPTSDIASILEKIPNTSGISSLLFSSTRFLNRANGVIALFSNRDLDDWAKDELKLVNTVSPQFGMSIAQLNLAEKEKRYLHHVEDQRHHAEVANRAKSDFLAKMTHELRTPLNSIIGFTEIVQSDDSLKPKQRDLIEIVQRSGDHLLDVINDILDLSKIEAGKIEKSEESFEFLPLLRSVYDMLNLKAEAKAIDFEVASRSALPDMVFTDRSKVRQTLINLIGNAIKFTDTGSVTLAVSATTLGEAVEDEGGIKRKVRINFEISDTGKGISKEDLPKLFEKYSQTESGLRSSEGTGLGLPIARSFIQLLGGDITVESEWGHGTTFKFYIECDEISGNKKQEAANAINEEKAARINGVKRDRPVRILVAEDQPNNRLLIRKVLGRAKFELAEAHNGQQAVEMNESFRPELILMDEDMPILKGSEAAREIVKTYGKDAPAIVSLTAYAMEQAKQAALAAGCTDFLAKPFKAHEIFSCISRNLDIEYTFEDVAEREATAQR